MKKLMTKPKALLIYLPVTLLIGLFAIFYFGLGRAPQSLPLPSLNQQVAEFSLKTLEGKIWQQKDLQDGEVKIINIFASWCVPCLAEHPSLTQLSEEYQVPIYGVVWNDTAENIKIWLKTHSSPYQLVTIDDTEKLILNLGVYGVPETFIIDGQGIIRYRYAGAVLPEILHNEILPEIEKWRDHQRQLKIEQEQLKQEEAQWG